MDTNDAVAVAVERFRLVREAVGPHIGIGLDFHGRVKLPMAKQIMKALEPYQPLFYEEVVVAAQNAALPALAAATTVPLATGKQSKTKKERNEEKRRSERKNLRAQSK